MTSIKKEVVLLEELNFRVRDLIKEGYKHFRFDVVRASPKGVQIKAWKDVEPARNFECPGTRFDVCEQKFVNPTSLDLHMRTRKHGKYAQEVQVPA